MSSDTHSDSHSCRMCYQSQDALMHKTKKNIDNSCLELTNQREGTTVYRVKTLGETV